MFALRAPYPAIGVTTLLPNPQCSDSEGVTSTVTRRTALDGTRYTYVKRRSRRRLSWTFHLSRNKALELRAFIQEFFASQIQVTDHNNRVWVGCFVTNPFEFETTRRSAPAIQSWPRAEQTRIQLVFEGIEQ